MNISADKIKQKLPIILMVLFLLFGLSKCTQSCNRATTIDEQTKVIAQRDSLITVYRDSIVTLNQKIELLNNDKTNQEKLIETQKESIDKINEAKKNINVTLKK